MRLLIAALAVAASSAVAAPLARSPSGDWVRLSDKPCSPEVLAVIPEAERDAYHAAKAQIAGKQYDACWVAFPESGAVYLRYSDGEAGVIGMSAFRDDPDI